MSNPSSSFCGIFQWFRITTAGSGPFTPNWRPTKFTDCPINIVPKLYFCQDQDLPSLSKLWNRCQIAQPIRCWKCIGSHALSKLFAITFGSWHCPPYNPVLLSFWNSAPCSRSDKHIRELQPESCLPSWDYFPSFLDNILVLFFMQSPHMQMSYQRNHMVSRK